MRSNRTVKKFLAVLLAAILALSVIPSAAFGGEEAEPDPKIGTGRVEDGTVNAEGYTVIEGKLPKDGGEPERQLADHGSTRLNFYPDPDGAYKGDYVVIYNPNITDNTGKSTGTLTGLIETSVIDHLGDSKSPAGELEDALPDDGPISVCGTPRLSDKITEDRLPVEESDQKLSFSVGSTRNFTIEEDSSPVSNNVINFTCLAVGTHCYVWTPTNKTTTVLYPLDTINTGYASEFANEFDAKFELMRSSFGDHWNGPQGDGRIHLLFYNIYDDPDSGTTTNGFFWQVDYTNNNLPILNLDTYPSLLTESGDVNPASAMFKTMLHEYQHLIHFSVCNQNGKDDNHWLQEMMSAAAEEICYPGSSVTNRGLNWLCLSKWDVVNFTDPLFERKNYMYSGQSGELSLYDWSTNTTGWDTLTQYGRASLYSQFLFSHGGSGNSIFRSILNSYATHSAYTNGDAISAALTANGVTTSLQDFNRNFWIAVTMNPAQGYSMQSGAFESYGFTVQDGYDSSDYHGLANPYEVLCPLVYTGSGVYHLKGGDAIIVKPKNSRFIPPSNADYGLVYVGVFTNEKLHYDTVVGDIDTYIYQADYPFVSMNGAAKSSNAGVPNSSSVIVYSCFGRPSGIRFRTKVAGEGSGSNVYDGLKVYLDNMNDESLQFQLALTNGQWENYELTFPSADYARMIWFVYEKDGSVNNGEDCAWIDDVEFLPYVEPTLNEALNYPGGDLTFSTGSDYPFTVDYVGNDSVAVSGNSHANGTVSYVTCRVPMYYGDMLEFEYFYETETNYDWFDFMVNGAPILHKSGSGSWATYTYTAYTSGIYTFTWQYTKDSSNHTGQDCVKLDNVHYISAQEQTYTIDHSLNVTGGNLHFTVNSWPTFSGDFWYDDTIVTAYNFNRPSTTATISTQVDMMAGDELSFEYYVSSEENYDWFDFIVNGGTEMHLSGNLSWKTYTFYAETTGSYTFEWRYTKDNSVNRYMDTVKLDNVEHVKMTPSFDSVLNDELTDVWMHFASTGDYPFIVNRENVYSPCAESSNSFVDASYSSLTSSVQLSAGDRLSFYYYISSEENYDWFDFYVNGSRKVHISGEIGIQYFEYLIPSTGVYYFEWRYTKDDSRSYGDDIAKLLTVLVRSTLLPGDADRNGAVDTTDALLILRCALGIMGSESYYMMNCDMDGNGAIDTTDALMILRMALGIS